MGYFFGISAAVLLIGAMLALLLGFSKEYKGGVPIPAERRRARIIKGLAVAALCVAIGAVVAVTMFEPWVVDSRLAEAEKITRDTFRQRFGREAGAVTFDRTNRKAETAGNTPAPRTSTASSGT